MSKKESVDTLHFDSQAFTNLWKTVIEKIKISSSSSTNGQRIADFRKSKNAEMEKMQKKKKERKKERKRKKKK